MTEEKLEKANELSEEISDIQTMIYRCKNSPCEYIDFTYGSGGTRSLVCDDPIIIAKARDLIIAESEAKLARLEKEFSDL